MDFPEKYKKRNKAWRSFQQDILVKRRLKDRGYHLGSRYYRRGFRRYVINEFEVNWTNNMGNNIEWNMKHNSRTWGNTKTHREWGRKWKSKHGTKRAAAKKELRRQLINENIL